MALLKEEKASEEDLNSSDNINNDDIKKASDLAKFVVSVLLEERSESTGDDVEKTLLWSVKCMMKKHDILFKGMMTKLDITKETGYLTFVAVANELFEGEKKIVNWGRVVAFYAFGGLLAKNAKEKKLDDFSEKISEFMGKYAEDIIVPFVIKEGGWHKLCEEFPSDNDFENKVWKFLSWTAIGLGLVTAASFFTSN